MIKKIGSILQSLKSSPKEVEEAYNSIYDNAEHCVCCDEVIPEGSQYCVICGDIPNSKKKRQIDRIRNMNILEVANFLSEIGWEAMQGKSKYPHEWEKWLESEVTE